MKWKLMILLEDSTPPKLVEKKKECVPSSEPIPYVGLTIPSVNGDFAPIKETNTKTSGFLDFAKSPLTGGIVRPT